MLAICATREIFKPLIKLTKYNIFQILQDIKFSITPNVLSVYAPRPDFIESIKGTCPKFCYFIPPSLNIVYVFLNFIL